MITFLQKSALKTVASRSSALTTIFGESIRCISPQSSYSGHQLPFLSVHKVQLRGFSTQDNPPAPSAEKEKTKQKASPPTQPPEVIPESLKEDIANAKDPKMQKSLIYNKKVIQFLSVYVIPFMNTDENIRKKILKGYFWFVLSRISFIGMPLSLKYGIDYLSTSTSAYIAGGCFLAYGILSATRIFADGRRNVQIAEVIQDAWKQISLRIYDQLLSMELSFHLKGTKASLFSINKAKKGIENNLRFLSTYFIPLFFDIAIACAMLVTQGGPLAFLIYCGTVGAYFHFTTKTSRNRKGNMQSQKEQDKIADYLVAEALDNYTLVKTFNAEKIEMEKYSKVLDRYAYFAIDNARTLSKLNFGQGATFACGLSLSLMLAAHGVYTGTMTVGDVVLLQSVLVQSFAPMNILGSLMREWWDSAYEFREVFGLLEKKSKITDPENPKEFQFKKGEIEFKNVSFYYDKDKKIVENLNIKFPANSMVALAGESGTGKTTLFNLIFRFYDPQEGDVLIDGQNVKELSLKSFREKICIVSQHVHIFNDTVINNLLYANPNKTREEIIEVCKHVNLHSTIMGLPDGYDTLLGDKGSRLSGGERQRLSIARCILKDTPIILLDEITSALDSINENQVMDLFNGMKGKRTIIYITHRMHLHTWADFLVVLRKDGKIETGTHEELTRDPTSRYSELWMNYLLSMEDADTEFVPPPQKENESANIAQTTNTQTATDPQAK